MDGFAEISADPPVSSENPDVLGDGSKRADGHTIRYRAHSLRFLMKTRLRCPQMPLLRSGIRPYCMVIGALRTSQPAL